MKCHNMAKWILFEKIRTTSDYDRYELNVGKVLKRSMMCIKQEQAAG